MKGNIYRTKYGFQVRFGRKLTKHFKNLTDAEEFLSYIRVQTNNGEFDLRDYQKNKPLGFENLAIKWLNLKQKQVKRKSFNNLNRYMNQAIKVWGNRNIKSISNGDIEDFLYGVSGISVKVISDKTRSNMKSCLHSFFVWVQRREKVPMPDFPDTPFELETRQITDIKTQQRVLSEVQRIAPFKVWLGVKWLCTYISVRPGELVNVKEKHINRRNGTIIIEHPKEKNKTRIKTIHLDSDDIELLNRTGKVLGMPDMYFFRHSSGKGGIQPESQYGDKHFYKWWVKACKVIGLKGVSLYAGTRHTSATELGQHFSNEQVKDATGHASEAFNRYFLNKQTRVKKITDKLKDIQKNSNQHLINIKREVSNN